MSKPKAKFLEDSFRFDWEPEGVAMVMERFKDSSQGLKCELTVECSIPGRAGTLQAPMMHNLMTNNRQLVSRLEQRVSGVDWDGLFTQANGIAITKYREGGELVDLMGCEPQPRSRFILPPYVSAHGATVWAADGGTGKSVLALAVCMSIATNIPMLGPDPRMIGSSLYLDWEADKDTHQERAWALWRGLDQAGEPPMDLLHYSEENASLSQIAPQVRRRINETGAVMVVVDSLGQARGGGVNDDESTNQAFKAARSFGVPVLFIDHVSKKQRDGDVKKRTSIGSVYTRNNARLLWVVEKDQDEGADKSTVGFVIDKWNFGRLPTRRGLSLSFENTIHAGEEFLERVEITEASVADVRQIVGSTNRKWDVWELLKAGPLEAKHISDATGMSASQVTDLLKANPDFFVRIGDKRPYQWANLDRVHEG